MSIQISYRNATSQQVYDAIVLHLRKQNDRSEDGDTCLYRGPNGFQCAIGCLIKDKYYNQNLEKKSIKDLLEDYSSIVHPMLKSPSGFQCLKKLLLKMISLFP